MTDVQHRQSRGLIGTLALILVVAIGAFLIILPLGTGLPGKSEASANLMSALRPAMTDAALAQVRADQQLSVTANQQLTTQVIPALAAQLHMTPAQFSTYLAAKYPDVAKGLADSGAMNNFFGNLQDTMQAQQSNFQQADQIPTGFMSPTSLTWLFVVPGVVFVLLGGIGLMRPAWGRNLLIGGGALGLAMIAALLAVSMYSKASSADQLTTAFTPVFSSHSVSQAQTYTATMQAMETQLNTQVMPDLATALHVTPAQLATQLGPFAATMQQLPAVLSRTQTSVGLIAANAGNFDQTAAIPWAPGSMVLMFWFMLLPALAAFLIGALALVFSGNRETVASSLRPHGVAHG